MAHHNYLIGHNTSPDRNKTNPSRLTALTPQNQPERPLLRGDQSKGYGRVVSDKVSADPHVPPGAVLRTFPAILTLLLPGDGTGVSAQPFRYNGPNPCRRSQC